MSLWVRPIDRQLLGQTVGGMRVDVMVAKDDSSCNYTHTTISVVMAEALTSQEPKEVRHLYQEGCVEKGGSILR